MGGEPKIVIEHVNRITNDTAPQWPRAQSVDNDAYRIEIKGSPNITQETVFRDERLETAPSADAWLPECGRSTQYLRLSTLSRAF